MSKKNMDNKNRWRSKTIAFRMSPEESEFLINLSVSPDIQNKIIL